MRLTTLLALLLLPSLAVAEDADFTPQVQALFAAGVCGGGALPAALEPDRPAIDAHCVDLKAAMDTYRGEWLAKATPFFAGLVPAGLPDKVVYPYGGADLLTALAVYPEAVEYTTLSLESAGDPRGIERLHGKRLAINLRTNRKNMTRLMTAAFSATTELAESESSELPGHLLIVLSALAVHGYEPVGLRYFTIDASGNPVYVSTADVAAYDKAYKSKGAKTERELRVSIFSNAELTFRKAGDAAAPLKTHRQIAANLYDEHLPAAGPLLRHLEAKGRIAAMTKAASHLLWYGNSSKMRSYLLNHMDFMVSDSTGIPTEIAAKASFEQLTYGSYTGAHFAHRAPDVEAAFVELWKKQPARDLPMRFGYFDKAFKASLLITRPKTK